MMKRPLCTLDPDEILLCCVCVCVCGGGGRVFQTSPPPLQWNVADDDGDVISPSLKFSNQGGPIDEFGQSADSQKKPLTVGETARRSASKSIITAGHPVRLWTKIWSC